MSSGSASGGRSLLLQKGGSHRTEIGFYRMGGANGVKQQNGSCKILLETAIITTVRATSVPSRQRLQARRGCPLTSTSAPRSSLSSPLVDDGKMHLLP